MHVAEEGLLAGVDHLHRPAGPQRQQADVDLEADVLAGPERPAHAAQRHADLLGRQAEAGGDLVAVGVEPLGGDEQLDAAVARRDGQRRIPGP